MHGKTIAEKILSQAAGRSLCAGELAICLPDLAMGTDGSIPMALDYLEAMCPGAAPRYAERLVFAFDHYGPSSGPKALALQARARNYAATHGINVIEVGVGIGHQCILESGAARPGRLIVGADSHSTTYGAANAFATGIGSSDLAGAMFCGKVWLKVPHTMAIIFTGELPKHSSAKDIALVLAKLIGADGAAYMAIEFQGEAIAGLDMDDRIVLSNMAVELGAKAGIFPCDDITRHWLAALPGADLDICPVEPDDDAVYARYILLDLGTVRPQVAIPHRVDNVLNIDVLPRTPVNMVYLGTCTGGRIKDYHEALDELKLHGGVAKGVRLVVTPASEIIRRDMESSGMLAAFAALGAEIQAPGCGSCCGTCGTVPNDGENVLSTANRNFKGRMGNAGASIFLASPRSCGAAAGTGYFGSKKASKH
jgi:3-isopropylmalate/(R)-2-methylmalate dehydratase large subunit